MAPPTEQQILEVLTDLVERRSANNQHPLFSWNILVAHARRAFNSTTPAIEARLNKIVERGELKEVEVSHQGFVRLNDEMGGSMRFLYFQFEGDTHRQEWGYVTFKRETGGKNLWTNGNRYLLTTKDRFDELVEHFSKLWAEKAEQDKREDEKEESLFWDLAKVRDPDARQVLAELEEVLPGAEVRVMLGGREPDLRPYLTITTKNNGELSTLLSVLRRGLAAGQ